MAMKLSENGHVYALFVVVLLGCALGSLSQTAVNAMLEGFGADFGFDAGVSQWFTTIYMLVLGITVPVVAYLSKRLSTRSLVYVALGFLLAGSAVAFFAWDFASLMAGRALQAISAGITMPFIQTIAMTRFPENKRSTMMGIAGIAMGFAPNIGPTIGGALVDSFGWRSFFVLLGVCAVVLAIATAATVERDAAPAGSAKLDVPSLVLSTLGFGGALLSFSNAANFALMSPLVWVPLIVGVVCVVAFVVRQKRIENPLINMDIFSSKQFVSGFVAQNFLFASFMGITLIIPMFVMNLQGGTALESGMVLLPAALVALFLNPLAGFLCDKVGVRPVVIVASVFLAAGSIAMVFIDESTPLWLTTVLQTVRAIGVSCLVGPYASWTMAKLPGPIMMDGSAFSVTARQAAASLGTALMVFFVMIGTTFGAAAGIPALGYHIAFGASAVLSVGVLLTSVLRTR